MTSGPNTGPGNTPMILQSIIATQLVHVVGGLNKIDEKMDVIVGLVSESLKNQNTSRGPKSKNDDGKDSGGPGIADIAIGSAIGGVVASVVTSLATKLFSAVTGVFTTLAGSITRYLTPVALVSSAIQSSSSGYSTMGKAFQVLGTAMGMVLLPAFALVGATATTLADRIASDLLPVLGDWIEFILTNGITAIEYFVANVKAAADTIEIMTEAARKFAEWAADSGFLDGITIVAATDTLYNAGKYVYDNMSDQDKQTIGDLGKGGQMGLDPLSSIFQQRLNERLAERGR